MPASLDELPVLLANCAQLVPRRADVKNRARKAVRKFQGRSHSDPVRFILACDAALGFWN